MATDDVVNIVSCWGRVGDASLQRKVAAARDVSQSVSWPLVAVEQSGRCHHDVRKHSLTQRMQKPKASLMAPAQLKWNWKKTVKQVQFRVDEIVISADAQCVK